MLDDAFGAPPVTAPPVSAPLETQGKTFAIDCTLSYELSGPSDFIFLVHALQGMDQHVLSESLQITPALPSQLYLEPVLQHRLLRVHADLGAFTLRYCARVLRVAEPIDANAPEVPIADLPVDVLHHLMPTRYCESDLLSSAAQKIFGAKPPGVPRVMAIIDWLQANIEYRVGTTVPTTTARDVFVQRTGVCRDFAHLAITFCRALNIPARLVVGYSRFDDPPPDFHAVFEAFLGGRWVMFDPTCMSPVDEIVRIAVGSDAKDVAFATIYGPARMLYMAPLVEVG